MADVAAEELGLTSPSKADIAAATEAANAAVAAQNASPSIGFTPTGEFTRTGDPVMDALGAWGGYGDISAASPGTETGWGANAETDLSVEAGGGGGDGGGGGGTVICTELHRQGILDDETYSADSAYGATLPEEVLIGYRLWATPIAKAMSKSNLLTKVVSWFAIPWAKEMSHRMGSREKGHIMGKIINKIGIPVCKVIGVII